MPDPFSSNVAADSDPMTAWSVAYTDGTVHTVEAVSVEIGDGMLVFTDAAGEQVAELPAGPRLGERPGGAPTVASVASQPIDEPPTD